jgi:hypothetical protein
MGGKLRRFCLIPLAIVVGIACVYGQDSPTASFTPPLNDSMSEWQVRPCTAKEFAVGSSPEIAHLFSGERPDFNWCEALEVRWLPDASILRFHTAVHVDYAYTDTIIKATSESPFWSIVSGEGMVEQSSPNLPNSLGAMNDLLRSMQPALKESQLKSASILYLFLLGRENRQGFFRRPESKPLLSTADYPETVRKHGDIRDVKLTTRSGEWKLTFSSLGGRLRLDSAVKVAGN